MRPSVFIEEAQEGAVTHPGSQQRTPELTPSSRGTHLHTCPGAIISITETCYPHPDKHADHTQLKCCLYAESPTTWTQPASHMQEFCSHTHTHTHSLARSGIPYAHRRMASHAQEFLAQTTYTLHPTPTCQCTHRRPR